MQEVTITVHETVEKTFTVPAGTQITPFECFHMNGATYVALTPVYSRISEYTSGNDLVTLEVAKIPVCKSFRCDFSTITVGKSEA